jgi:hypothetical protein
MPNPPKKRPADREQIDTKTGLPGKPVSASCSEIVEAVLPNDANPLGKMLGGRVMHLIDIAGALAATRHSNSHVVTASVDYMDLRRMFSPESKNTPAAPTSRSWPSTIIESQNRSRR